MLLQVAELLALSVDPECVCVRVLVRGFDTGIRTAFLISIRVSTEIGIIFSPLRMTMLLYLDFRKVSSQ